MIDAILNYEFMQNALLASLFAGILSGIMSIITVEKKLTMMSGGIAHTAYGGVGLGYLLGIEPLIGAAVFSVGASFGIGYLRKRGGASVDIIISMLWALGMAAGVAFIALMPGYPPDLNSYLFGNILTTTKVDIITMALLTALAVLLVCVFFGDIRAYLFDESFSAINGLYVRVIEYSLLVLISLSVVVLLRVVGIVLVIALLSIPAACSALLSQNLRNRMIISSTFSTFFCVVGLTLSFYADIPSGATIIFVASLVYLALLAYKSISEKIIKRD